MQGRTFATVVAPSLQDGKDIVSYAFAVLSNLNIERV